MKKIYVLALTVLFAGATFAQNVIVPKQKGEMKKMQSHETMKLAQDTLMLDEFFADTPQLFGYTGGGYWMGVNIEGNTQCAQGYINIADIGVEEVLLWVGGLFKKSTGGSSLTVTLNGVTDSSVYGPTGGPYYHIICPNATPIASCTVPFAQIDSGSSFATGAVHAVFASPVHINGIDFAAVADYSNFITNGDTLGFVTSFDGGASAAYGLEYEWWLYASATPFWTQISHVFSGADNAIGFFPVYSDWAGVGENSDWTNGVQLRQNYPNPAVDGNTYIDYAVKNSGQVTLEVYNYNGQIVDVINEGVKAAGQYTVKLSKQLPAGVYYYSLMANNFRFTKKMVIE
jgi:hypothetical protein